jgi:hypothetical protein
VKSTLDLQPLPRWLAVTDTVMINLDHVATVRLVRDETTAGDVELGIEFIGANGAVIIDLHERKVNQDTLQVPRDVIEELLELFDEGADLYKLGSLIILRRVSDPSAAPKSSDHSPSGKSPARSSEREQDSPSARARTLRRQSTKRPATNPRAANRSSST